MNTLRIAGFVALVGLSASVSQSDVCGCALAPRAGDSIHIAEESAIIVWDAATRTQHFIRRAQFDTKAQDFGFLVPTPTRPALSEVDDAVFGYLVNITRPPVRDMERVASVKSEAPKAAAKSLPPPTVTVLESVTVAGLDAAVLEANDARALDRWLRDHGYSSGPELAEWFKPYIAAKWIMTAFKISKGQSRAQRAVTSAVRMSFKTDQPFFPYREPATRSSAPRALEVYFVSGERVEGRIGAVKRPEGMLERAKEMVGLGATSKWPGNTLWAQPLAEGTRKELLTRAKLPANAAPANAWLTRFLDSSSPRPGTDELYFSRASAQSQHMDVDRLEAELQRKEAAGRAADYSGQARSRALTPSEKALTRSERERLRDEEAAANALKSAAPSIASSGDASAMLRQADELQRDGRMAEAVRVLRRAARAGSGAAALQLGDIFDKGRPGISRDYAESLQWYDTARGLGAKVPQEAGKR